MNILIVEDESSVSEFIKQAVTEAGYSAQVASNLNRAEAALKEEESGLILLDVMLPDGDGVEFLRRFRSRSDTPVLLLTARDSLEDRVRGLDAGADDFLGKPFRLEELLARIRALLRRPRKGGEIVQVGDLTVDLITRKVTRQGRVIYLSVTEFSLLEVLARHRGRLVSKTVILKHVWEDEGRDQNLVEVYINYLRHKLEPTGSDRLIHTIRSKGYVLNEGPPD